MKLELMLVMASRGKIRFQTPIGLLCMEDLWDLPLSTAGDDVTLNTIAQGIFKEIQEADTGSFVTKTKPKNVILNAKLDLVKYVIKVRQDEADKKELALVRKQKKARIMELIEKKEDEIDGAKTIEELMNELEDL